MLATIAIHVNKQLPCGCQLKTKITVYDSDVRQAQANADFWVADRAKRHDCALVSSANPNGTRQHWSTKL